MERKRFSTIELVEMCTFEDLQKFYDDDVKTRADADLERTEAFLIEKNGEGFKHPCHKKNEYKRICAFWEKTLTGLHLKAICFLRMLTANEHVSMHNMFSAMHSEDRFCSAILISGEQTFQYIKNDLLFARNNIGYRRYMRTALGHARIKPEVKHNVYGYSAQIDIVKYNEIMNTLRKLPSWMSHVNYEKGMQSTTILTCIEHPEAVNCFPRELEGIHLRRFVYYLLSRVWSYRQRANTAVRFTLRNEHNMDDLAELIEDKIKDIRCLKDIQTWRKIYKKERNGAKFKNYTDFANAMFDFIIDGMAYAHEDFDKRFFSSFRYHNNISLDENKDAIALIEKTKAKSKDIRKSGSISQMIRDSGRNHRLITMLELELQSELIKDTTPMLGMEDLPDELEELRIKTKGEMSKAGIECHHCIGSYGGQGDTSLFFRKGSVCAQVLKSSMKVYQCFDEHDHRTKDSVAFETWLHTKCQQFLQDKLIKDAARKLQEKQTVLVANN